ncbi:hypothetical protein GCM10009104_20330 [Marinobacterium maritimum]|uniref:Uncharacterized protein n=1 Tax=Marinobacterium maritimum TaxID=500162 RepID=A0ABP3TDX7_9GAMM
MLPELSINSMTLGSTLELETDSGVWGRDNSVAAVDDAANEPANMNVPILDEMLISRP